MNFHNRHVVIAIEKESQPYKRGEIPFLFQDYKFVPDWQRLKKIHSLYFSLTNKLG